jgi:xanthine dehydrogenase accessory factor
MVLVGEAPMARAIAEVARVAGFDVAAGGEPRAGDAALVVASHGEGEERALEAGLALGIPYVALVASRRRGEAVRAALDVPAEARARVHVPAGLDIGARTPPEVAVSIVAQIIAERAPREQAAPEAHAHCHEH